MRFMVVLVLIRSGFWSRWSWGLSGDPLREVMGSGSYNRWNISVSVRTDNSVVLRLPELRTRLSIDCSLSSVGGVRVKWVRI